MDGIRHRNNRTVTHRLFSRRAVNTFAEKFRTIAAMLVERALDRESVDFIGDIACYMPLHEVSELLGIPAEDREQVLAWTNLITVPLDPHFTPSQAEFEQALNGLWRYGLQLSGLRGTEPDESIMSAIARGHANGVLSDDEVSGYMLALAAAGNETTRNALAIGLHALLLRPEQMTLLRAQGGMPESAVEEILRWASPAIHTVRLAKEDVTLHGQTIRAGDRVALLLSSANFDPRQFVQPDEFNVARAANDHVAFGTAAHTCLGLHVARLELKILFEELLRRAPEIELAGKVEFIRDNLVHGIRKMPITFAGHG
jgi:cholest-4-en-3-one 26-monooxygenase